VTKAATRPRVLVAEDEFLIATDLAEDSQAIGADVLAVKGTLADLRAAIEVTGRIDLAVLDINLRGEMVYPVVDELIGRQVPVVFATGYDADAIPPKYARIERCEKPVSAARLAQVVRKAVAEAVLA
jgi:CheY-like chemotaxis protein